MDCIEKIKNEKIKIKNKKRILDLVNDYGYFKIISCYGDLIKTLPKNLYNTNNICKIFSIDKTLSKIIIFYLLDFEQKLNAKSIGAIVELKKNDDYILNPDDLNFDLIKSKSSFIDDLYNKTNGCNCLIMYDDSKQIPLNRLSISWSFHTLISFINIQDIQTKNKIINKFNINSENIDNFISTCHSIRKFRNTISHNDIFFITTLNYYRREFNTLLNYLTKQKTSDIEKDITIYSLIKMLEKLLNVDICTEVYKILNDAKINKKLKLLILDYMQF